MQTSPSNYFCNLAIFTQKELFTGSYQISVTRFLQNSQKFGDLWPATLFKRDSSADDNSHFLTIDINHFNFGRIMIFGLVSLCHSFVNKPNIYGQTLNQHHTLCNLKVMIVFESENMLDYVALVIIIEKTAQNLQICSFPRVLGRPTKKVSRQKSCINIADPNIRFSIESMLQYNASLIIFKNIILF